MEENWGIPHSEETRKPPPTPYQPSQWWGTVTVVSSNQSVSQIPPLLSPTPPILPICSLHSLLSIPKHSITHHYYHYLLTYYAFPLFQEEEDDNRWYSKSFSPLSLTYPHSMTVMGDGRRSNSNRPPVQVTILTGA